MVEFQRVITDEEIAAVADLASEIWNEHFVPIIGKAQVDYMLDRLQSEDAIAQQIASGWGYYLISNNGRPVGYLALVFEPDSSRAQLSKIYIRRDHRGSGVGKQCLEFAEDLCSKLGLGKLWLTVNKGNKGPISFYEHNGFVNAGPVVQDIGGGFIMDDYRMEKSI